MANSLRAVQPGLEVISLPAPVSVTLADGRAQACAMEVTLDLELVTIAGPVSLRSVPCLVLDGDGGAFLLGKDALKRLGIDVDQAIAQLADSTLLVDEDDEFPVGDEFQVRACPQSQLWRSFWIGLRLTGSPVNMSGQCAKCWSCFQIYGVKRLALVRQPPSSH
ncbi:hypothetical protein PI125_g23754 [Phytophthora idaei]|nr:hypothetical protein PI125_g23754 [Phytophthora idaei]